MKYYHQRKGVFTFAWPYSTRQYAYPVIQDAIDSGPVPVNADCHTRVTHPRFRLLCSHVWSAVDQPGVIVQRWFEENLYEYCDSALFLPDKLVVITNLDFSLHHRCEGMRYATKEEFSPILETFSTIPRVERRHHR